MAWRGLEVRRLDAEVAAAGGKGGAGGAGAVDCFDGEGAGQVDFGGEAEEVVRAGVGALARDGERLPAAGAVGEGEVVERRERPAAARVHQEGDVLEMVVAVVQKHVEAGAQEELALRGGVAQERGGEAEEDGVFVARDAEVGVQQPRGGVQVE